MKIFDTRRFFYTLDHTAKPVTGPEELITDQGLIFTTENYAGSLTTSLNYCSSMTDLPVRKTYGVSYL